MAVDPNLSIEGPARRLWPRSTSSTASTSPCTPATSSRCMGPNGAGKSTLLKTIFGMTTSRKACIRWRGKNIAGAKPQRSFPQGIGYRATGPLQFSADEVDEICEMAGYIVRDREVKAERDYVFELFPILKARRYELAGNLSGGEQQLLEIAMAVLRKPEIVLVDEPSVGLSPQAITFVFNELKRLHAMAAPYSSSSRTHARRWRSPNAPSCCASAKSSGTDGREITHAELGELFMTGQIGNEVEAATRAPIA